MTKGFVLLNKENVEYYTPKNVVGKFGEFDYDPATTKEQAEYLGISNFDTKETDGLSREWDFKRIWINPPFDKKHLFFKKAIETYKKFKNEIYFLCPVEFLTTNRFHDLINVAGGGVCIYIPKGRIKFISGVGLPEKSPAFGSVIIKIQDKNEVKFMEL